LQFLLKTLDEKRATRDARMAESVFPLFTQVATGGRSSYPTRSKLVGTLSTNPQRSSQQQGSIVL